MSKKITLYRDVVTPDGVDMPAKIEIREEHAGRGKNRETYISLRVAVTYTLRTAAEATSREILEDFKDFADLEVGEDTDGGIAEIDEWLANYRAGNDAA
ncbi:hypothetical protein A9R16_003485 [Acidiferrobacter thiooxydans]|uniref:hypothetical protein n=1 Tax=Acidiferrobacter thiooxydans TaxID=163359 RepID=UPI0008258702|nr:hypothetical protein [Acidiferrobacter thiooxydans]UEO00477.1 hypothetical protein A9R16_003485 [Acidiferrobacter thiooxydans]